MLTRVLPFIEGTNNFAGFTDFTLDYTAAANAGTIPLPQGARTSINAYLCPSVGGLRGSTETDPEGFGYTDYAAIILVDNTMSFGNPGTSPPVYQIGVFNARTGRKIGSVTDGTSNTIGISETTGRSQQYAIAHPWKGSQLISRTR